MPCWRNHVSAADARAFYRGLRIQTHPEVHEASMAVLRSHLPPGTEVLDVAAGSGAFTQRVVDAGYRVSCTSWNEKLGVSGVDVYRINLDNSFGPQDVGERCCDAVCCLDIIEHVKNPFSFLSSVTSVLRDPGWLILSVPNIESALSRLQALLRGYPLTFMADEVRHNRHISMPNRHVLEYMFEKIGLEISEERFLPDEIVPWDGLRSVMKNTLLRVSKVFMSGNYNGQSHLYALSRTAPVPERVEDIY